MFTASAEFYDLIYGALKNYAAETQQVAELLRRIHPRCESVLDVACGTGEHARLLAGHGFSIDGLDLDPSFLAIARKKYPAGRFFEADMADFSLPWRYDAIVCLFSSIGYVRTLERAGAAFVCFRRHLAKGGVVLVEPWFQPGVLDPARVGTNVGQGNGVRVTRVSRVEIDGCLSRLLFDYEITDGSGTRHASEVHELGLFTNAELLDAFTRAGLSAAYDPQGLTGRGLYVARIAP
jgi:SAM-dependent methyltransferase